MVTSKQLKEVQFNYSLYLISSNEVRPFMNKFSFLDSVPKVWPTCIFGSIDIHHTLTADIVSVKPEQTLLIFLDSV